MEYEITSPLASKRDQAPPPGPPTHYMTDAGAEPSPAEAGTRSRSPIFALASVVMPVRDAADTIAEQLEALSRQTYAGSWELIISDNGSSDETLEIVESWAPRFRRIRVVDASDRKGVSHARNVGARAASGALLCFCDSDDRCDPGWLQAMVEGAAAFDVLGGVLDPESINDPITGKWRPAFPEDRLPTALGFLSYAVGANCAVRKSVFEELGGWREDYLAGADDVEFSWRAQLADHRVGFAPDARIHYRYRKGLRALARQFARYGMMEAKLYREFHVHGVPRSSVATALKEWAWIAVHVVDLLRDSVTKGAWVRKVAYRWGRLRGSIRERVLFL